MFERKYKDTSMVIERDGHSISRLLQRASMWLRLGLLSALASILMPSTNAWAQLQLTPIALPTLLYPAKFVCGFEEDVSAFQGNVPPPIGLYRNFEPGHYSMVLNILNASRSQQTIQVVASVMGASPNPAVATLTLDAFEADRLGCPEISTALGVQTGELIEGFVHISRYNDDLEIKAVYSYTSKDSFITGGVTDTLAGTYSDFSIYDYELGGAGGGGLGLGASIDVVKIEPRIVQ